jgi:transposase
METKELVEKKQARQRRAGEKRRRYRFEEKLKAVRLVTQEGFSHELVCKEVGIGTSTLAVWLREYRAKGEAGLQGQTAPRPGRRLPAAITEKIVEIKRANRWFGVKRIADTMRRLFLLPASPETVRKRLHEAGMMDPAPKPRRNLTRPRFFERASPNQMWQSDIFTFRLGGKYAYVVAFMDDYSRYVVNLDLYRSPTAEAVIETYRVAVGEYHPPKEMLTDRGRQYTSWRGKSRFAMELQKDRVAHIVSRLARLYWERYRAPVFIAETASVGPVRPRSEWLRDSVAAVRRVRESGVPLVGYTWWPLFALVTWGYRQGTHLPEFYLKQMGLWDLDATLRGSRPLWWCNSPSWRAVDARAWVNWRRRRPVRPGRSNRDDARAAAGLAALFRRSVCAALWRRLLRIRNGRKTRANAGRSGGVSGAAFARSLDVGAARVRAQRVARACDGSVLGA